MLSVIRPIKAVSQLLWPDKDREVPGFPVKLVGVDKLHAAFLNESRTRGRCLVPRTGNPGVWFSLEENHDCETALGALCHAAFLTEGFGCER